MNKIFKFKQFEIEQIQSAMKVNTDGILLGSWAQLENATHALDIGTGTGLIALMLAQRSENLSVDAIEIDSPSYKEAHLNVMNSKFSDRVSVFHESIQNYSKICTKQYDLIVSNPPFFTGGTMSINENKANVRHTVKLSHIDLLNSVKKLLSQNGFFDIILPYVEGMRFIEIAQHYNLYPHQIVEVKSRSEKPIERCLIRLGFMKISNIKTSTLVLSQSPKANDFSAEFVEWVKDFYIFL